LEDLRVSPVYETDPVEVTDQPKFLNAVVSGLTRVCPDVLLARIQEIEQQEGRDRSKERRKGERPLDIDILLYGDRIIQTESLVVPHKSMRGRLFVLVPLLDLDPQICEPGTGRPYSFYRENLAAKGQGIYTFTMKRYSLPHGTV